MRVAELFRKVFPDEECCISKTSTDKLKTAHCRESIDGDNRSGAIAVWG